jgi:hypothetical protein
MKKHHTLHQKMSSIQKANAFPTWWVGKSPKHGLQRRVQMPAGLTDDECKKRLELKLAKADMLEDKEIEKEIYILSDEYPRSKLAFFKNQELQALQKEIQDLNWRNNASFAGGYTGPAIISHKAEADRITAFEDKRKQEIEEKYNGSPECLDRVRELAQKEDAKNEAMVRRNELMAGRPPSSHNTHSRSSNLSTTALHPRVGGAAARHAAAHGGGFNHRGVYAGGVWN